MEKRTAEDAEEKRKDAENECLRFPPRDSVLLRVFRGPAFPACILKP